MTDEQQQQALIAARTAIREVEANYPPGVHWNYASDAVSAYLTEAGIDHTPLNDVNSEDYEDEIANLVCSQS